MNEVEKAEMEGLIQGAREAVNQLVENQRRNMMYTNISWTLFSVGAYIGGVAIGMAIQKAKDESL